MVVGSTSGVGGTSQEDRGGEQRGPTQTERRRGGDGSECMRQLRTQRCGSRAAQHGAGTKACPHYPPAYAVRRARYCHPFRLPIRGAAPQNSRRLHVPTASRRAPRIRPYRRRPTEQTAIHQQAKTNRRSHHRRQQSSSRFGNQAIQRTDHTGGENSLQCEREEVGEKRLWPSLRLLGYDESHAWYAGSGRHPPQAIRPNPNTTTRQPDADLFGQLHPSRTNKTAHTAKTSRILRLP